MEEHKLDENPYPGFRKGAFSITAEQLELTLPEDKTTVFGVMLDIGMEQATVTLVSYATGDASMYLSTGGGVIGGGVHKNVNAAAKAFVKRAQTNLVVADKTEDYPLPELNQVFFYLLTNKGVYVGKDVMENILKRFSAWTGIFEEANKVLNELRISSGK
jgi:predicted Abi (CAAX) family protease